MKRRELLELLDRAGFDVQMHSPDGQIRYQIAARCAQCGEPYHYITMFRRELNAFLDALTQFDLVPMRICSRCSTRAYQSEVENADLL
jgi:hypothetical protein